MVVNLINGTVEPAPGVDLEGLEVAKDCLTEVFNLNSSSVDDDPIKPDSLVDIFSSLEASKQQQEVNSDISHGEIRVDAPPSSSSVQNAAPASNSETSKSLVFTNFILMLFLILFSCCPFAHIDCTLFPHY